MRPIVTAALLLLPLASAHAQFMPRTPPPSERLPAIVDRGTQPAGPSAGRDLMDLRGRIAARRDAGDISRQEARALRREARQIEALTERYGRDGLSDSERREIDMRTQALRSLTDAPARARATAK